MSVQPPPIVTRTHTYGDCRDRASEDRYYEEMGFDHRYRLRATWGRIGGWMRRVARPGQRRGD